MDWIPFIREFGFPITVIAVGAWALYKRVLVLGRDSDARLDELKKSHAEELARQEVEKTYREERRIEERSNRLMTEEVLRNQVTVMRDMTELLKDIERNIRGVG